LLDGKLVASVPKGAEGFRVDYADGTVVDLGTEFAMSVRSGGGTEVGVFDGEIELHTGDEQPMALFENQSVLHRVEAAGSVIEPIPFRRDEFIRRLPSRDFAWEIRSSEAQELEFDVTHLVWKPGNYRAIFKWINGRDAIDIRDAELRIDGRVVSEDSHSGTTGILPFVRDNLYRLDIPSDAYTSGRWTLHVTVEPHPRTRALTDYTGAIQSSGVLQFEDGLATNATAGDFIGRWSYRHLGSRFVREFHPDGTITLFRNGKIEDKQFVDSRWTVDGGVLTVTIPELGAEEKHILRDLNTLVFMSNPYENAVRESSE
ncbi:MAG: FecR domain-containing protein, partial [Verrucomicrobiae bacterium]|nr:FecR domain-containing protein [Verrucomicrobiae bacterium]